MNQLSNSWYEGLNRPPLTPPNWIFGPVWTALYIILAVSIVLYYRSTRKNHVGFTTSLVLTVHLAANFVWTYLFFGLRSPGAALLDIVILDLSLIPLLAWFMKSDRVAGILLVPYLIWLLFATYLNGGFYWFN